MTDQRAILVIEDEDDLAELVCFNLKKAGYSPVRVVDAGSAMKCLRSNVPDLVVLDRMLPDQSGDVIAKSMRQNPATAAVPILMLTARAEEQAQLSGFAAGADDYVTKPFSMKVLVARVDALLRRTKAVSQEGAVLQAGAIRVDPARHEVTVGGTPVSLTSTEFSLLRTLMTAGGRVLDRDRLITAVLGPTVAVTDRTIDVHIAAIRKKLGGAASWVQTVRGVGYTFREP
jgi:two-component system, OmpR family, phosphate regulon response regulator PhoB